MGILTVFVGVLAFGIGFGSVAAGVLAKGRAGLYLGIVAMCLGLTCFALGGLGVVLGRRTVDSVLSTASVDPAAVQRIHDEGYREAGQCLPVGGVSGALPLLLGAVATLLVGLRKRPDERAP